ncbi:MAG: DedA family protein [Parachlamydiales bacterium]
MDWFITFITTNAPYAHWFLFGALMLAGLNVPISEDLMLIISGVLASAFVPENLPYLFAAVFLGSYLSDFVAYWLGYRFGPKLWEMRWFAKTVKRERLKKMEHYYAKYGVTTLLVGRFIPFGVRNCLFMSAGMAQMPLLKFAIADGIACLASNSALFWLAYYFGKNYDTLLGYVRMFDYAIFATFLGGVVGFFLLRHLRKRRKKALLKSEETE